MASIFSRIINGELPGHFVWEDEQCVAIMTIQPIREGHLMVIPRQEVEEWTELPADLMSHMMQVAQRLAQAQKQCFPSVRSGLMLSGLDVPHVHIHVLPIDSPEDMNFANARNADAESLADCAQRLKAALS